MLMSDLGLKHLQSKAQCSAMLVKWTFLDADGKPHILKLLSGLENFDSFIFTDTCPFSIQAEISFVWPTFHSKSKTKIKY